MVLPGILRMPHPENGVVLRRPVNHLELKPLTPDVLRGAKDVEPYFAQGYNPFPMTMMWKVMSDASKLVSGIRMALSVPATLD